MDGTHFLKKMSLHSLLELRQNFFDIVLLLLAMFQPSKSAYRIVSMRDACSLGPLPTVRQELRLNASGINSAASVMFDAKYRGFEPEICAMDLVTVNTRLLSFHLSASTQETLGKTASQDGERSQMITRPSPQNCPLSLYSKGKYGKIHRLLQRVDLCSGDVITLTEIYSRHHVTLVWSPPHSYFADRIQLSELVVTAVSIGPTQCKLNPDGVQTHFPCSRRYGRPAPYCVATELLCDGRRNCPVEGEDEDSNLCLKLDFAGTDAHNVTVRRNRQNKVMNATEGTGGDLIRKLLLDVNSNITRNATTNTTAIKGGKINKKQARDTLPEALAHYGPWGYLMLGMLISGSVLMICGIWECCCRNHKPIRSTQTTPPTNDIFIISSSPRAEETSPPAYDDLDQPPAYNILFPATCKTDLVPTQDQGESGTSVATNS